MLEVLSFCPVIVSNQRPKFSVPCCLLVHEVWRRRPKERTLLRHLTACFSVFSRSPLILACVFKKLKEEDRKSVNNCLIMSSPFHGWIISPFISIAYFSSQPFVNYWKLNGERLVNVCSFGGVPVKSVQHHLQEKTFAGQLQHQPEHSISRIWYSTSFVFKDLMEKLVNNLRSQVYLNGKEN